MGNKKVKSMMRLNNNFDINTFSSSLIILFFLLACSNEKNEQKVLNNPKDTANSKQLVLEITPVVYRDSILEQYKGVRNFSYKKVIKNDTYSIEVETFCLNDTLASLDDTEYEDAVFSLVTRPVIIEQKLKFTKKGNVLKSYNIPFKKIVRTNYLGKKIETLEQNIWLVYFIKGTKGEILGVSGSGLCEVSECPEFTGFYSLDGNVLYEADTKSVNNISTGELFEKYGITDSILHNSMNSGVRVDIFWARK